MNIDIIDIDTVDATTVRIDGTEFAKADCSVSAYGTQHAQIVADGTTFLVSHGSAVDGRRPSGQAALLFALRSALVPNYVSVRSAPDATAAQTTASINAAVASLYKEGFERKSGVTANAYLGEIRLGPGEFRINASIALTSCYRVLFRGAGAGATRIIWEATGGTAIELRDCAACVVEDVEVYVAAPYSLDAGCSSIQDNSLSQVSPTANKFNRVSVVGNEVMVDAFLVNYTSADATNDFNEFNGCSARGYSRAAVYLRGLQSHVNYIRNPNFIGLNLAETAQFGQYGIYATSGSSTFAASFVVESGVIGGHSAADFFLNGGAANGAVIKHISSEGSTRLLDTANVNGSSNVLLENVRYASDAVNADGYMIRYQLNGVLSIQDCALGNGGSTSSVHPKIYLNSNNGIFCRVRDTRFGWTHAATSADSTQASPIVVAGNQDAYADIKMDGCTFVNPTKTTMASYLHNIGAPGTEFAMLGYYGDTTYHVTHSSAATMTHIRPAYPNQEITVVLNNTNTTVKHNSAVAGTGKMYLKTAADFTPTLAPCALKFKWNVASGRWMQL